MATKTTTSTGTRPAWVTEDVATAMSTVAGFPTNDASKAAIATLVIFTFVGT